MRFNNTNFRSLNESINYVQNPHRELDEALEYADTLESVILSICEELEIDPDELVEMAMTQGRNREHRKILSRAWAAPRRDDPKYHKLEAARKRAQRESDSKKIYGKGGKISRTAKIAVKPYFGPRQN